MNRKSIAALSIVSLAILLGWYILSDQTHENPSITDANAVKATSSVTNESAEKKACADWGVSPFSGSAPCNTLQTKGNPSAPTASATSPSQTVVTLLGHDVQKLIDRIEAEPKAVHREYAVLMDACYKAKKNPETLSAQDKKACELALQHKGRWQVSLTRAGDAGSDDARQLLSEQIIRNMVYSK